MRRYWDSSALIDALHDDRIEKKAFARDQWTRVHTLAETFSTLKSGRLGFRYSPDDAAALMGEITSQMNFVELDAVETLRALKEAQKRGVRGGRVHDWLHAVAAKKAGAEELVTDNASDFMGLVEGISIVPA